MSLTLYFHPLSSFCHKVLIALYENDTPFKPHIVDLMDAKASADVQGDLADRQISGAARRGEWPDDSGIEHHHRISGAAFSRQDAASFPNDADAAREMRDCTTASSISMCNVPMQKVVTDRLRPAGQERPATASTQAKAHARDGAAA